MKEEPWQYLYGYDPADSELQEDGSIGLYERDDPAWRQDYVKALSELNEGQLLLPAPDGAKSELFWTTVIRAKEPRDVAQLSGPALRLAILEGMTIKKTADPCRREVYFGDEKAGECFKSPWTSLCWVSSRDRRAPMYSLTDAAVRTIALYLGRENG